MSGSSTTGRRRPSGARRKLRITSLGCAQLPGPSVACSTRPPRVARRHSPRAGQVRASTASGLDSRASRRSVRHALAHTSAASAPPAIRGGSTMSRHSSAPACTSVRAAARCTDACRCRVSARLSAVSLKTRPPCRRGHHRPAASQAPAEPDLVECSTVNAGRSRAGRWAKENIVTSESPNGSRRRENNNAVRPRPPKRSAALRGQSRHATATGNAAVAVSISEARPSPRAPTSTPAPRSSGAGIGLAGAMANTVP